MIRIQICVAASSQRVNISVSIRRIVSLVAELSFDVLTYGLPTFWSCFQTIDPVLRQDICGNIVSFLTIYCRKNSHDIPPSDLWIPSKGEPNELSPMNEIL